MAFLDEAFTGLTLLGMALILGGSWIAGQSRSPAEPAREPARLVRPEAAAERSAA